MLEKIEEKVGKSVMKQNDDRKDKDQKSKVKERIITIKVNEQPVKFTVKKTTGYEIKAKAISQAVMIETNFVLQQELPNGKSQIIGDQDEVSLHNKLKFTAIAPDDNS